GDRAVVLLGRELADAQRLLVRQIRKGATDAVVVRHAADRADVVRRDGLRTHDAEPCEHAIPRVGARAARVPERAVEVENERVGHARVAKVFANPTNPATILSRRAAVFASLSAPV